MQRHIDEETNSEDHQILVFVWTGRVLRMLTDVFEGFVEFAELTEALLHHAGHPLVHTLVFIRVSADHCLQRLKKTHTSVKTRLAKGQKMSGKFHPGNFVNIPSLKLTRLIPNFSQT